MTDYKNLIMDMNGALSAKNHAALHGISEELLQDKIAAAGAIKEHYNETVYNTTLGGNGAPHYPKKSILREIFQNIIDCTYPDDSISIDIKCNDVDRTITFKYNELGFKISDIISFFSLGHTTKDETSTGAFGVGIKGAISNSEELVICSTHCNKCQALSMHTELTICPIKQCGMDTLFIKNFGLSAVEDNSSPETFLTVRLKQELYLALKANLVDIASMEKSCVKGEYITPFDLLFATLKSKKNITITVIDEPGNTNEIMYNITQDENSLTFKQGDEGVEFSAYTGASSGFSYLIPSIRYGADLPRFVTEFNYNYFSTYELTGDENRSKVYINLPALDIECLDYPDLRSYITFDRKAINSSKYEKARSCIKNDFSSMIERFGKENKFYFNLDGLCTYSLKYFANFLFVNKPYIDLCSLLLKYIGIYIKAKEPELSCFTPLSEIKFFQCLSDFKPIDTLTSYCIVRKSAPYRVFDGILNLSDTTLAPVKFQLNESAHQWFTAVFAGLSIQSHAMLKVWVTEKSGVFDEEVLQSILTVISEHGLNWEFRATESILKVSFGENQHHEYELKDGFTVTYPLTLFLARNICSNACTNLFKRVLALYQAKIFKTNESTNAELTDLEKIQCYNSPKHSFAYKIVDNALTCELEVYIFATVPGQGVHQFVIDSFDVSKEDYSALYEITQKSNYNLLVNRDFNSLGMTIESVIDIFDYDQTKIQQYKSDLQCSLSNIYIGQTDYKFGNSALVLFIKNNKVNFIRLADHFDDQLVPKYDYVIILCKNNTCKIDNVSQVLDKLFGTGNLVSNLYKEITIPNTIILDQFDYRLNPLLPVSKTDFYTLQHFLLWQYTRRNTNNYSLVKLLTVDLSNKFVGYASVCSVCGFSSTIMEAFAVRTFDYYTPECKYELPLYLCANDHATSSNWMITNVVFDGAESFVDWLKQINDGELSIPTDLLRCKITFDYKMTYKLFNVTNESTNGDSPTEESINIILTPLMAVKWYTDNSNKCLK